MRGRVLDHDGRLSHFPQSATARSQLGEPPRRCERIVPGVPYAERDGLRLYYERDGHGGLELLFVPGWCCGHMFFAPQFDYFKPTHTVTTLALRGCGRSDSPSDGYDIPSLADDITWFCAEVGIERPVVVGHSLGGMIAIELGARHPSIPSALVAVDPGPVHPTDETALLYADLAKQLKGPAGEDVRRAAVLQRVGPTADDELRKKIVDTMCSVPLPVARAVIEGVTRWDGVSARDDVQLTAARPPVGAWRQQRSVAPADVEARRPVWDDRRGWPLPST